MSQENVETVRDFFGDPSRFDPSRFFDVLDEEVELDIRPMTPGYQEIIHGKDAVIDFWRDYLDTWDEYVLEPTEIREAGEDQVVSSRTSAGGERKVGRRLSVVRGPSSRFGPGAW